jgi:hypothetical protein
LTVCRLDGAGFSECGACVIQPKNLQCSASEETDACWKCEDEGCCDTQADCRNDPDCVALLECMKGCQLGDYACDDACVTSHGDGLAQLGPRLGCIYERCNSECGGNACSECIYAHCPTSAVACESSADCWRLRQCVGECDGNVACVDGCFASHPDTSAFEMYIFCAMEYCAQACQ